MRVIRHGDQAVVYASTVRPRNVAISPKDWQSIYVLSEAVGDLPVLDVGPVGGDMEPRRLSRFETEPDSVVVATLDHDPEIREISLREFPGPSFLLDHELNPAELLTCNVLDFCFVCDNTGCLKARHITTQVARHVLPELKAEAESLHRKPVTDLTALLDRVLEKIAIVPVGPEDIAEVPRTFVTSLERLKRAHDELLSQGPVWRGGIIYSRRLHLLLRGLVASDGIEVDPFLPYFMDVEHH